MAVSPLLIKLDPARTVPKVIEFLKGDCSQREGIHYLFHLRKATTFTPQNTYGYKAHIPYSFERTSPC